MLKNENKKEKKKKEKQKGFARYSPPECEFYKLIYIQDIVKRSPLIFYILG